MPWAGLRLVRCVKRKVMYKQQVSALIDTHNRKPFIEQVIIKAPGDIDLVPPNAIGCLERLHPRLEVILFSDEAGVAGG